MSFGGLHDAFLGILRLKVLGKIFKIILTFELLTSKNGLQRTMRRAGRVS